MESASGSTENGSYYTLGVVFAVLLIILSSWFTLRNILKLWTDGKPVPVDDEEEDDEVSEEEETTEERIPCRSSDIDSSGKEAGDWVKVGASDADDVDPVQFCEHIQSEVKKAKQKVAVRQVEESLTEKELEEERNVQRQQLEQIFKLMEEQKKFGVDSFDDVQQQMKLYA